MSAVLAIRKKLALDEVDQGQPGSRASTNSALPTVPRTDDHTSSALADASSRQLLVVLHGKRADDPLVRSAVKELREAGHEVAVRVTWDSGDTSDFVRDAIALHQVRVARAASTSGTGLQESPFQTHGQPQATGLHGSTSAPAFMDAPSHTASHGAPAGDDDSSAVTDLAAADVVSEQAAAPPGMTIVAAGGDGTLNEVVAALLDHGLPQGIAVAHLPLGTANDFAAAAGISMDPAKALALACDPAAITPVDVARVNGAPFMNVSVAGAAAAASNEELSSGLKRALGPLGIVVHVGKKLIKSGGLQPCRQVVVRYGLEPGAPAGQGKSSKVAGDLVGLAAGQGRQMGGTFNVCPDALLDDGALDFTLLWAKPSEQTTSHFSETSEHLECCPSGPMAIRAPWLEVVAPCEVEVNRDGEPQPASHKLLFDVLPRALKMHLPPNCPAIQRRGSAGAVQEEGEQEEALLTSCGAVHGASSRLMRRILKVKRPEDQHLRKQRQRRHAALALAGLVVRLGLGAALGWAAALRLRDQGDRRQPAPAAAAASPYQQRKGWRRYVPAFA